MRKKIKVEEILETEGPMNAVALDDARTYLGLDGREELSPDESRSLRAKKKKIVTSSKKLERRMSREATIKANRFN